MGIRFTFRLMKTFHFRFSTCLRLSISTSKFPFLIFFTFFGVARTEIIFSIRNRENLARQTSSRDSMTMNLGKSAASFSESDSDKFLLFFLIKDTMSGFLFSLALCSTTHNGVQLEKGMNQRGNPFALVETGIHDQYTYIKSEVFSFCKILSLKPYN